MSFQGQEQSNIILADDGLKANEDLGKPSIKDESGLVDQRSELRKMRLYLLGALTEQFIAWLFHDLIPREVLQRTRRSLNMPGIFQKSSLKFAYSKP